MLEPLRVAELIKQGVSPRVDECRTYAELINMHVTGLNVHKYAEEFNLHESIDQKAVREKLMKSNKSVFSFLTRPLDKIFTAKGGSINYNLNESKYTILESLIEDVSDGLDIKTYLKKKVKQNYIIDPNGFVMVDIDLEGTLDTKVFNTKDFIYYENRGNQVNGVIFNPFENINNEDDKKLYYRVIDENTDSIYVQDGETVYQLEESIIENFFGFVPAFILGDIYDFNSNKFLSVIDDVLDDANEHLRDLSVNTVHKLSHGYAKYWQYPESCTTCGGDGLLKKVVNDVATDIECYTCNGSGVKNRKDASDLMLIDIPKDGEDKLAPDVGGYINPSIEIWKQYKEDIADLKIDMFQCLWGSTYKTDTTNETATGRLLNVQPEAERVSGISKTFASIHQFLLDCYGIVATQSKDYQSQVSYGTRYLMESPDEVLSTFVEAVKEGLPVIVKSDLLDRFYQTEYANNSDEYIKKKKILSVDPFPMMTATEVKELGVDDKMLKLKIFHPQWANQLTDAKKELMTRDELELDLKEYVNKLNTNIKQNEVQQGTGQST